MYWMNMLRIRLTGMKILRRKYHGIVGLERTDTSVKVPP